MSLEDSTNTNKNVNASKDTLTGLEDEILQKKPKGPIKLIYTIVAISLFFAAFNLTIFYKTFLLVKFLCSPDIFSCIANPSNSGLANTIYLIMIVTSTIAFMIALVVGGAISDDIRSRFGNRVPMIFLGSIIAGLGYIVLPILVVSDNVLYVFLAGNFVYIFINIGLGFALASDYALISELFVKEERGWVGLGFAGVGLGGTLIGYGLSSISEVNTYRGWVTVGLLTGIIIIVLGLLTFILTPKYNPPFPADGTMKDILATPRYLFEMGYGNSANRDFLFMFIIGILWGGGGFIIDTEFAPFLNQLLLDKTPNLTIDPKNLLVLIGLSGAILALPVGIVIAKLGKVRSGMIGSVMMGFFTFMVAQNFMWSDHPIYAISVVLALGTIFITAVNVSLPADLVPRGKEGQFMGLFIIAANLLSPVVGLLAVGVSAVNTKNPENGFATVFLLTTIIYFVAVIILAFMHYEEQLEGEYQMYYRRYLLFKGYVSDKTRFAALKVSSSLRFKRSK